MSTLSARLASMRERTATMFKPEIAQLVDRHIAELRNPHGGNHPLQTGAIAPAFSLKDSDGNRISSMELLEHGPLVLSFVHGTWSPFCTAELTALNGAYQSFRRLGASLVVVTPQAAAFVAAYRTEHSIAFPLLIDANADVAEMFGLAYTFPAYLSDVYRKIFKNDLARVNASGTWRLPIPARYVIDAGGAIVSAVANPDYRFRPDPEATLAAVAALTSATCAR
jgi:peroxiredoxin